MEPTTTTLSTRPPRPLRMPASSARVPEDNENYARRFGNMYFSNPANIYDPRKSDTAYGQVYRSGYGPSINQLGTMFDTDRPENLLPSSYLTGKVRAKGKDKPLSDEERYPEVLQPLDPNEQIKLNTYLARRKEATRPYSGLVLSSSIPNDEREPMSRSRRKELNRQLHSQRETALATAYADDPAKRYEAEDLLKRDRKVKAFQREMADQTYFDPMSGETKEIDPSYRLQRRALQNIRRSLPASITRPEYAPFLRNRSIRGRAYETYDIGKDLVGHSLQTLSPEERNQQIWNLFRMVGILNARPVYDKRLVSIMSAQKVYSPADYNIFVWDGDANALTPGTVVITTKYDTTNSRGEVVPAGSPISIGGWRLADATEANSIENLKDILYYNQFPTKKLRTLNKRSDYIGAVFGKKDDLRQPKGLQAISKWLRFQFQQAKFFIPDKIRVDSGAGGHRFMDIPTYFALTAYATPDKNKYKTRLQKADVLLGNGSALANAETTFTEGGGPAPLGEPQEITYLKLSTPIFNTLLSWIAKLFFSMFMLNDESCPFNPKVVGPTGTDPGADAQRNRIKALKNHSIATRALVEGIKGNEIQDIGYDNATQSEEATHYDIRMKTTNEDGITVPTCTPYAAWGGAIATAQGDLDTILVNIHERWNKAYFDDAALSAILRDDQVSLWIDSWLAMYGIALVNPTTGTDLQKEFWNVIQTMAHVILYHTMNASLADYVDDIVGTKVDATNYSLMYRRYAYAYQAQIKFLDVDKCKDLLEAEEEEIPPEEGEEPTGKFRLRRQNGLGVFDAFKIDNYHTVSKKNWQTVIAQCHISRRCFSWVGKSYLTDPYERTLIPRKSAYDKAAAQVDASRYEGIARGFAANDGQLDYMGVRDMEYNPDGGRTRTRELATTAGTNNPYTQYSRAKQRRDEDELISTLRGGRWKAPETPQIAAARPQFITRSMTEAPTRRGRPQKYEEEESEESIDFDDELKQEEKL